MRILMIGSDPTIFDEASATRARMHAYAAAIGELHVVSTAPRGASERQEGGLFLYPVHAPKFFRIPALARRARPLILEKGIEVVSAQDPFEHGLAALRAVRGTRAKLHVQVHTDFLSPWFVKGSSRVSSLRMALLNRYRCRIADRTLPATDGIRVVSERVKASLVARYGSRIPEPSVIPIAIDATVPAPARLPEHPFTFALIAVGRLEPEKRLEDTLSALALVRKKYPMAGLLIVGSGGERARLERLTRVLALERNVIFLGERPDARALMGSAQAFIQASAYEGYGRTLIEAALAKIPIITTDVGIVGDVLKGGEDVLAVPVADPTALSLGIARMIEDMQLRLELVMRAEAAAHAHLAAQGDIPERVAKDLEQVLHRV